MAFRQPKENVWSWRAKQANVPVITLKSYSRFNDLTFSVGRKTTLREVNDMLIESGCYKKGELHDYVNQIRLTSI